MSQRKSVMKRYAEAASESPPLFLPEGSVRAILTFCLLFCGILLTQGIIVPEWLSTITVGCFAFYFGTRNQNDKKQKIENNNNGGNKNV